MAHFAKIEEGIVTEVIVAEQDYIDSLENASQWIQTSYNTRGGKHLLSGTPLRKNYAGVGFVYNSEKDAFIAPQPFPSWVLNEESCVWESPIPYPDSNDAYSWEEESKSWKLIMTLEQAAQKFN